MRSAFKILAHLLVLTAVTVVHAGSFEDFFRAVNIDNERMVRQLLERGFDPNAVDDKGMPALMAAMRDDSDKAAALLVEAPGLKLEATTPAGETALMMAALKGKTALAQRLLARGAAVSRDGWTPLHYAASGPDPSLVALLLERGAAIDAVAPNGNTPLMMAARYGDQRSAEMLLLRGANPRLRNKAGQDAADFARTEGRDRLADFLAAAAAR